jgi:NAD(P)H-dependent FMN reductase
MKKILAICGSTRKESVNLHLLQAIAQMFEGKVAFEIYRGLGELPHFNQDLDIDPAPAAVEALRSKMLLADGILVCTPEYVFSLPGSLKNVMEWMVSTTILSDKPVALITASSSGHRAHEALQLLMSTIGARIVGGASLVISAPKNKISTESVITDATTKAEVKELMESFLAAL